MAETIFDRATKWANEECPTEGLHADIESPSEFCGICQRRELSRALLDQRDLARTQLLAAAQRFDEMAVEADDAYFGGIRVCALRDAANIVRAQAEVLKV